MFNDNYSFPGTPRLYHGDCLQVMRNTPLPLADLLLTDLPYGTTRNKWDSVIPLEEWWAAVKQAIKPGAAVITTAGFPFDKVLASSNLPWFRHEWIWEKSEATGHLNAKKAPMRAHETVLIFCDRSARYFPIKTTGHPRKVSTAAHKRGCKATENYGTHGLVGYDSTERYPRSVIRIPKDKQRSKLHPTQKPVALMRYLIDTYSLPGEIVMDCCMGSGSTGVACAESGRLFVGIEQDEAMFKVASDRLSSLTMATASTAYDEHVFKCMTS